MTLQAPPDWLLSVREAQLGAKFIFLRHAGTDESEKIIRRFIRVDCVFIVSAL